MNGVIVVDKPSGWTSRAVVEEVKRALDIQKAGHTGTLDPLATGVLPVCLDEATKLVQFLALDTKDYRGTLLLGVRTDTLDTEGRIIAREEPCVTPGQVVEVFKGLVGKRDQVPPLYSAVKFRGRPLYDWTRRGIDVEQVPREVEIYRAEIEEMRLPEVVFSVSCSKGTYIRSLCAEAGEALGCGGCLSGLRRTRSGIFNEERAITMECLRADGKRVLAEELMPMAEVLPHLAGIDVDLALAGKLQNGYQPDGKVLARYHIPFLVAGDVVKFSTSNGKRLVAIAQMLCASGELASAEGKKQAARVLRVFNE